MCYSVKSSVKAALERTKNIHSIAEAERIEQELNLNKNLSILSGFDHPNLVVYTKQKPEFPQIATWGLIPNWVKSAAQRNEIWNKTLNARIESITEKPAFSAAAKENRCLLFIDGFYESQHQFKETFPYFIFQKNKSTMCLAAIYTDWFDDHLQVWKKSFSIVTTKGNQFMSVIHNNPKLKEARMPLILSQNKQDEWLFANDLDPFMPANYIIDNDLLAAHTAEKPQSKIPNHNKDYSLPFHYPILDQPKQGKLF